MAPAVLISAAATAAMISAYANKITVVAGAATSAGTIGWMAADYFRKVPCPSCTKMVRVRDFMDHARSHTFQCPSCQEHVKFSDLEKHAQHHGFRCTACYDVVPLADFGPHLDRHRREDDDERARQGDDYVARVRELTREYEERTRKIQRAEDEFNQAKERAKLLWSHLKVKCHVCKRTVCIAEIESHVAQHNLGLKPSSNRRDELASIKGNTGIKSKDSKIKELQNIAALENDRLSG
ncbi:uncharacterized protein LOC119320902 [Triticum dicoccoides]|uniref:uncharacterized protein LOC119320902 n=1 Tax=Triticum dicoccoides TaxID=85692 RepID=UPI001891A099|nr:uncharacterized protein LOC119320902 [Triticum dicoccoides]